MLFLSFCLFNYPYCLIIFCIASPHVVSFPCWFPLAVIVCTGHSEDNKNWYAVHDGTQVSTACKFLWVHMHIDVYVCKNSALPPSLVCRVMMGAALPPPRVKKTLQAAGTNWAAVKGGGQPSIKVLGSAHVQQFALFACPPSHTVISVGFDWSSIGQCTVGFGWSPPYWMVEIVFLLT